ncbi:hypothetical protein K2Z84_23715 [Candidatus Binatia bacterium]|jgi:hypothetical protein|nr:hypothetical protein [Candidatus Binatia bacterium]
MKARRSHADTRATRTGRLIRVEVMVALLALAAQLVLPVLHRWQAESHGGAVPAKPVSGAASVAAERLATATHTEASCPICQALASTHDFLISAVEQVAPDAPRIVTRSTSDANTTSVALPARAARAPPATA